MNTKIPKYLLVEEHIRQQIIQRKITHKLPGERILARDLGYSYMTVRKAIENLVNEGILYKVPTKGTFVADRKQRKTKTGTIGYFLDHRIAGGLSSPYYSMIFNALEKETSRNGCSLIYFSDNDPANLRKVYKKLDGVIASCFPRVESLIQELKEQVPIVAIDNSAADKTIPSIIIDNFSAQSSAVDHLCALGHERIGIMTGLEDSDVGNNRYAGYQNGLNKNGIDTDPTLVFRGNYTFGSGVSGVDYFLSLEQRPTAIVCANDSMALGAMNRLYQQDVKVPDELSVVGFDDIDIASQIVPPLTTIKVPVDEIAERAFGMLKILIEGKEVENRHVALVAKLVVRGTTREVEKEAALA